MIDRIRQILMDALQLEQQVERLEPDSALLGAIPELDSMAVVTVLTMIEEEFDFEIEDDEVSADIFETLGSLTEFVSRKAPA